MKTKTISYTKTFQVYQFVNDKISIEDTFPSTVSDEECFKQLMERIDALGRIAYPHLYQHVFEENKPYPVSNPAPTPPPVIDISKERLYSGAEYDVQVIPSIEQQISEITDPKVLESFRLLVKGKPHLQELFDNKLKELNNNQK